MQMPQSWGQVASSPAPQLWSPQTQQSSGQAVLSPFSQTRLPQTAAQSLAQLASSPDSHRPLPQTPAGLHSPRAHTRPWSAQSTVVSSSPVPSQVTRLLPWQATLLGTQLLPQSWAQLAGVSLASQAPLPQAPLPQAPGTTHLPSPQMSPLSAQSNSLYCEPSAAHFLTMVPRHRVSCARRGRS